MFRSYIAEKPVNEQVGLWLTRVAIAQKFGKWPHQIGEMPDHDYLMCIAMLRGEARAQKYKNMESGIR